MYNLIGDLHTGEDMPSLAASRTVLTIPQAAVFRDTLDIQANHSGITKKYLSSTSEHHNNIDDS